jgi:ADP-ribose pyrophosphatase YjhB (NUDIX family)
MEISAGLLIVQQNRILLGHPTNAPWYGTYTIPKGKVEEDESLIDAAIRETYEEIGIKIDINDIKNKLNIIEYKNEKGVIYKIVKYFVVEPKQEIIINKSRLQKREIDWAGFLDKDEARARIFWRYEELLDYIT